LLLSVSCYIYLNTQEAESNFYQSSTIEVSEMEEQDSETLGFSDIEGLKWLAGTFRYLITLTQ